MPAPRYPYEAIRVIYWPPLPADEDAIPFAHQAVAYRPGDLVAESAVVGPDAWLEVGTDVIERESR